MRPNTSLTRKADFGNLQVDTYTHLLSGSLSLRAYTNTDPPNGKIACLQKGLVLVVNGTEAVGEGTGFGLPVLVYSGETYFSGSSRLCVSRRGSCCVIRKEFEMDRIARNSLRNVKLENRTGRAVIDRLSNLYQRNQRFRFLTLKLLTGKMSVNTIFPTVQSVGKITVTYTVEGSHIVVGADFNCVERNGLRKVFMLNEQGSRFFCTYSDSNGARLTGKGIGAWDAVNAQWACLKTAGGDVGFRLWRTKGSILRMGREFLEGSLDWVGLDFELTHWKDVFEYSIEVLGTCHK